jgi:uncharacterized protein YndB with AHSA1/START domain
MTRSRVLVSLRIAAPPERTFVAFTTEIGEWWRPNGLFQFTDRIGTHLAFEPDPPERLVEIGTDGTRFEIGPVLAWEPPTRIVFGWQQSGFPDGRSTEVSVRFDAVATATATGTGTGTGTRISVEHVGWDAIPQEHAARHGFPLSAFQTRVAEWWNTLLRSLGTHVSP